MKFRKKPVVIEAFQYGLDVPPTWFTTSPNVSYGPGINQTEGDRTPSDAFIKTLEGTMQVRYFEWVIKGVQGEIYPCKPDIFEATYERVE